MNKTLYIIVAGIIVIAGLIGYTVYGTVAPHDDTGLAPHTD